MTRAVELEAIESELLPEHREVRLVPGHRPLVSDAGRDEFEPVESRWERVRKEFPLGVLASHFDGSDVDRINSNHGVCKPYRPRVELCANRANDTYLITVRRTAT